MDVGLRVQDGFEAAGEFRDRSGSPEVREVEGGIVADHVIVQSDDVYVVIAHDAEHGLDFFGGHDEVTVHRREVVSALEGRPA